jgi:hypothetical protein
MKTKISFSLLLAAAAASGLALGADTAYTTPVGYETIPVVAGFNYLGVRLHNPVIAAGTFETVTATSVTDTGAVFSLNAGQIYLIEIDNGSGVLTEIMSSSVSGSTISTTDNLVSSGVTNGVSYKIRSASSLTTIFGATNSAGLTGGFGGIAGADVVFIPNGSGGFSQFYYDTLANSWADVNGNAVNGSQISIVYTDGLIVSSGSAQSVVVSGEVKKTPTNVAAAVGFNYLGSAYPTGATLSSIFTQALPNITQGFGGIAGADVFFVSNGAGGFNQYYYDSLISSWADVNGNSVNGATINVQSGIIFSNEGTTSNIKLSPPAGYSTL